MQIQSSVNMWQNNGFGNGKYPGNNFNNNQENFPPSPFAVSPQPGQQHFFQPQPNHQQMLGMKFDNGDEHGFQPEVALFNEAPAPEYPQIQAQFMPAGRVQHVGSGFFRYHFAPFWNSLGPIWRFILCHDV